MIKSIGVIGGLGRMGGFHVKRLEQEHPTIEVHTIDLDWDTTTRPCDAYVIATPSETHYEIAKELIQQNKHVLVEKPVAMTNRQANILYLLAKEHNVVFIGGHTERFNPVFRKELPLLYGERLKSFFRYSTKRGNPENLVFDLMIHDLEIYCYLHDLKESREIEIAEANVHPDGRIEVMLAKRDECFGTTFWAGYSQPKEQRKMFTDGACIDFLEADLEPTDSLQGLHSFFVEACSRGGAVDRALPAVVAVGLAEVIQHELFSYLQAHSPA